MTAFVHFVFVVIGFSALFHFIDVTDPATMKSHRVRIAWLMAYEVFILVWAGFLLWGEL